MEKKRKRRFGDRKEGRLLRSLDPIAKVSPFIMKHRSGAQNFIRDTIELEKVEKFIRKKRNDGLKGFGLMHVLIATYLRTVAERPALNRFVSGQRIYARDTVEVILTIKKEMTLESPETIVKAEFSPWDTATDVYNKFSKLVEGYRNDPGGDFDNTAKILSKIPRLVMKFAVWLLNLLDYFGLLPRFLTKVSPFHGSFFITSMGSLGIPPIFHHLYDFGNVPIFCSFGAKQKRNVLKDDGTVKQERYVDITLVTDERICDGFYFASALKMMKYILRDPFVLDRPPERVVEDID
ncbi:MAG TPA: 2-oxo acid dehydrogenase subunit E2 [Clostridiales bacterium]|nr:2-oxo acid dehydrogenase subunit E2 [Clostridiales bacterium]